MRLARRRLHISNLTEEHAWPLMARMIDFSMSPARAAAEPSRTDTTSLALNVKPSRWGELQVWCECACAWRAVHGVNE